MAPTARPPVSSPARLDAVIFDLGGVVTDTASVHAAAWARLCDDCLARRAARTGEPFDPFTADLLRVLRAAGLATAIDSASRNCLPVLEAAGHAHLFDARVDGVVAEEVGLPGKPDPAVFPESARRLDVTPERAAVVEDALAGVEAGRRGGFALVIGVDRTGHADALAEHAADVVVADLGEVTVDDGEETAT